MATKPNSVNPEAKECGVDAQTAERDPFSHGISIAERSPKSGTSLDLLSRVENSNSKAEVAFLDETQASDSPPKDLWDSKNDN